MMQGKFQIYGGRQSAWRSFAVTLHTLPCLRLRHSSSRQRIGVLQSVGLEMLCVQSSLSTVPLSLSSPISQYITPSFILSDLLGHVGVRSRANAC